MTRDTLFYKILSAIHIVFFTSILFMGTIIITGTLLILPAIGAVFLIGKDALYKDLNVNDSIIKTYFKYLRSSMSLLRFFPVNLVMILNVIGMIIAAGINNTIYAVVCLTFVSFLLVLMFYLAGYFTFINKKVDLMDSFLCMLLKPLFLIPIFVVMIICGFYFSIAMLIILFLTAAFFLFAIEVVIFIQTLYYRKLTGNLDDEEEFAYLITNKANDHKGKK